MQNIENLISKACEARKRAYTPYSKFKVGAALLTQSGEIYQGCNIECASYSVSNCAERTAVFRAVYHGIKEFSAIAVIGAKENESGKITDYCAPCGVCRQMLREFCSPSEFEVILAKGTDDFKVFTLDMLLPESFGPENLK